MPVSMEVRLSCAGAAAATTVAAAGNCRLLAPEDGGEVSLLLERDLEKSGMI